MMISEAVARAISRARSGSVNHRSWSNVVDRASLARSDEMIDTPDNSDAYCRIIREVDRAIDACESPIEQVALYHMAGRKFSSPSGPDVFATVLLELPSQFPHDASLIIVPQVQIGPYRADFTVNFRGGGRFAVECDGAKYHQADRDAARDRELMEKHRVYVFRVPGRDIWRGPEWTYGVVNLARRLGSFK